MLRVTSNPAIEPRKGVNLLGRNPHHPQGRGNLNASFNKSMFSREEHKQRKKLYQLYLLND